MEHNNFISVISDLNSIGYKNPFNLNELIIDDNAAFEFKFTNDAVYIVNVTVYDTESLVTTNALKKIISVIDKHNTKLGIAPFILKGTGLSDNEFLTWIEYFNFEYQNGLLIRNN